MRCRCMLTILSFLLLFTLSFQMDGQSAMVQTNVPDLPYIGYRVHITKIQTLKKTDDEVKIRFIAINTGRETVNLGKEDETTEKAQILFDKSLESNSLSAYEDQIIAAVFAKNMPLYAGQIKLNQELNFTPSETFTARGPEKGSKPKAVKKEPPVEKEQPQENIEGVKEEIKTEIENTPEETTEKIDLEPTTSEEALCADLILENVKMVKKGVWAATIEFTVTNKGEGSATLRGNDKGDLDDVGIRLMGSTSSRMTKSAIPLGGHTLSDKKVKKVLGPNESYTGTMKVDITNLSKYTPFIIMELDANDHITECDEGNNRSSVKIN